MSQQDDDQPCFIILGEVWREKDGPALPVNIMLKAADDDSAVREALNALTDENYAEAKFDQIGTLTEAPIEEPHASAYQGALEGEVSIITYDNEETDNAADGPYLVKNDDEEVNPFDVLQDWGKDK